jgi:hypothetical protein
LFNERIKLLKQCYYNLIQHIIESQGKILALGASTKGNMICQFVGIGSDHIKCVLDNNIKKIGKVMAGSNIPVVDEKEWLNRLPKYLLLLPYYYVEHFVKMVSSNTKKGKTTFIIVLLPVPKLIKVIGKNNE